jgi:uncharacterized membrane protein YraQ (UPF0718 family)
MTALALRAADGLRARLVGIDRVWLVFALIALTTALFAGREAASRVFETGFSAFLNTLPFILVASGLVAGLKATGAESLVARAFEGRELRMIVLAALVGGLAPFCSCQVIPFIAGLLAVGAPLSAVMAFWLSSPLMDPASFAITAGALGWSFAVGKAVAAVGVGLAGGLAMWAMLRAGAFAEPLKPTPAFGCCATRSFKGAPVWAFWREPARRETFVDQGRANVLLLVKWLALAYLLEGLMIEYVPAEAVGALAGGDGLGSVIVGALVGMPAYLNGYAAPPLVAALVEQGMSAGAAMAFLTAGAVSCIPAMAAVWSLVRAPVFAAYVAFGLLGAIGSGLLFALVT